MNNISQSQMPQNLGQVLFNSSTDAAERTSETQQQSGENEFAGVLHSKLRENGNAGKKDKAAKEEAKDARTEEKEAEKKSITAEDVAAVNAVAVVTPDQVVAAVTHEIASSVELETEVAAVAFVPSEGVEDIPAVPVAKAAEVQPQMSSAVPQAVEAVEAIPVPATADAVETTTVAVAEGKTTGSAAVQTVESGEAPLAPAVPQRPVVENAPQPQAEAQEGSAPVVEAVDAPKATGPAAPAVRQEQPQLVVFTAAAQEQVSEAVAPAQPQARAGRQQNQKETVAKAAPAVNAAAVAETRQDTRASAAAEAPSRFREMPVTAKAPGKEVAGQPAQPSEAKADTAPADAKPEPFPGLDIAFAGPRVQGTAAHAAAPALGAEARLDEPQVMDDIIKQVSLYTTKGRSEMMIQLKPEFLGNVHMRLVVDGENRLTAQFDVENKTVKGIIESNIRQLSDALSGQGIRIEKLSVNVNENFTRQDFSAFADTPFARQGSSFGERQQAYQQFAGGDFGRSLNAPYAEAARQVRTASVFGPAQAVNYLV